MVRPLSSGQRGREERTWEGRRQDRRGRAGGGQGRDRQEQTDRCVLLQVSPACPSQGRSCHCPLSPRLLLQGVLQEHLPQALPLAARAPPRTAQATGATLSQSPGSHGGTERAPAGIGQVLREQAPLVTAVPLRAMDPKDPARVSPAPMGGGNCLQGFPSNHQGGPGAQSTCSPPSQDRAGVRGQKRAQRAKPPGRSWGHRAGERGWGPGVQPGQGPPNQWGLGRGAGAGPPPLQALPSARTCKVASGRGWACGPHRGLAEAAEQPLPPPDLPRPSLRLLGCQVGTRRACPQGDHGAQTGPGTGGAVHLGLLLWTLSRGLCGCRGAGRGLSRLPAPTSQPTHRGRWLPAPGTASPRQVPPGPDPPGTPGGGFLKFPLPGESRRTG